MSSIMTTTTYTDLELDILLTGIVKGYADAGKTYQWIYDNINTHLEAAIQEHEDANS
jgi:hypothetical protein